MDTPNIFEKCKRGYRFYYVVRFNIVFDPENGRWKYDQVDLPYGEPTYEDIVNAMISYKYPVDKMQAVINNYLLDSDDPAAREEFTTMQNWRKYSKGYAKEIMSNF